MKKSILVVEDDRALNNGIAFALRREGYLVFCAHTLKEAKKQLEQKINLILLDVNLPDGDGRDFLKSSLFRQPIPVLLLTARDSEEDMLQGFYAGCDDYITKPFSMQILLVKIAAVLRRSGMASGQVYANRSLLYDFERKTLAKQGNFVELTPLERRLLELFLRNRGIVLTREVLLEKIWDVEERYVEERTLNVTISRLRKKVEEDPEKPVYIRTVFGMGYQWEDGEG